jgi:hypothetical protein
LFPPDWQEVVIEPHRADVKTPTLIVELQHSSIDPAMIRERERFYGDMVWLFDLRAVRKNLHIREPVHFAGRLDVPYPLKLVAWQHARRSWFACTKPVLVHLARGELFNIFGFGFFGGLNFRGGFARRLTEPEFMSAVGAKPAPDSAERFPLIPFDALPNNELARNWQPYWHDEREVNRRVPLFEIRRPEERPAGPPRVLRLPIQY